MLHLLDTPRWHASGRASDLPNTLPGWTLAFLAVQQDWVTRERLCTLLWPDAGAGEAQHNLRVNLYRVRALLATWGAQASFEAERKRVRLQLPSDVAALRQSLAASHDSAQLAQHRLPLLSGMSFAGFPVFQEWVELERAALQARWREAALARLSAGSLAAPQAIELCRLLMATDALDEEAFAHQLRLLLDSGRSADARQLFEQFGKRLRQELGVDPPPALGALLAGSTERAAPHTAPARYAFVGRELELAQLEAMLSASAGWIVTLVGPGGVGKSRLARELAGRVGERWRDGVVSVALTDLTIAAAALPRLAEPLGLSLLAQHEAQAQVVAALATRQSLIVLDNAEHLADLPALLAELQSASPGSTWLLTSRMPLALPKERTYALEGLAQPEPGDVLDNIDQAMRFDAMRLLEARARALDPGFDIAAHLKPCLDVVRATGGWPLAIELAAAAMAQHGSAGVLADLAQSIDALAASRAPRQARHDSMRASLALSWRLLAPGEQSALACLSVFRGGFSRAAALGVTGCSGVALARLLERSLVQVLGNGRFDLHPLVAQFAAERLADDEAQRSACQRRHGEHFAGRLQACAAADASAMAALLQEIANDFQNACGAWSTLIAFGDGARIARSARAWSEFGTHKGRARELAPLIAAAMPATVDGTPERCALLQAAAILHYRGGALDSAQALARDALNVAAALGDEPARRAMLNTLALALKDLGRYDEAEQHASDGLRRSRAAGAEREIASHANTCAMLAKTRGDHAGAAALYEEAITIHRRNANQRSLAIGLNNLGNVHRARGDWAAAQASFEEALRVAELHGIASTRAFALVNLAAVHQQAGKAALALSFAERARAEPAAEIAVLLAADTVSILAAIDQQAWGRAHEALHALARRARRTGLHAALLDAVYCHAKLLAAQGRRTDAIARFVFLVDHRQLPAMQRAEALLALQHLAPTSNEEARARSSAGGFELDILVEDAVSWAGD